MASSLMKFGENSWPELTMLFYKPLPYGLQIDLYRDLALLLRPLNSQNLVSKGCMEEVFLEKWICAEIRTHVLNLLCAGQRQKWFNQVDPLSSKGGSANRIHHPLGHLSHLLCTSVCQSHLVFQRPIHSLTLCSAYFHTLHYESVFTHTSLFHCMG